MKVAFLFSGQLRDIPIELFRKSLFNLTEDLDYDIYAYLWDEVGKSLNHSKKNLQMPVDINPNNLFNDLFDGFNIKSIEYDSSKKFKHNLNKEYKEIYNSRNYHYGTINSMSQIYLLSKCFKLIKSDLDKYDLIFKCRFDSLFVHPLKLYNLEKIKLSNKIFTLNFGRAYYPNRIYDIFFGGSYSSMTFLLDIWSNLPLLVQDNFDNKLDKRDACRIFYLAAIRNGTDTESFDSRICDVYRNFKNNYYEKYLLSMHLISLKNIFKNLSFLKYFYDWFIFRKFSISEFTFYLIKSIVIAPISYIKRIKYKKYN